MHLGTSMIIFERWSATNRDGSWRTTGVSIYRDKLLWVTVSSKVLAEVYYAEAHDWVRSAGSTDTAQLFDTLIELSGADRFACDERETSIS